MDVLKCTVQGGGGNRDVSSGVPTRNALVKIVTHICTISSWTGCPKQSPTQSPFVLETRKALTWKVQHKSPTHATGHACLRRHADVQTLFLDLDTWERSKAPFLIFGNKPTFTSSCLKLLLNICNTVSKETVRGSIKFSNSSSSSPIRETKGSAWFKRHATVH
jgi:hypothetical protein